MISFPAFSSSDLLPLLNLSSASLLFLPSPLFLHTLPCWPDSISLPSYLSLPLFSLPSHLPAIPHLPSLLWASSALGPQVPRRPLPGPPHCECPGSCLTLGTQTHGLSVPFMASLSPVFQVTQTPGHVCEWQPPNYTAHQARVPACLPGNDGSSGTPLSPLPGPTSLWPAHRPGPPGPKPCPPRTFLLPSRQRIQLRPGPAT